MRRKTKISLFLSILISSISCVAVYFMRTKRSTTAVQQDETNYISDRNANQNTKADSSQCQQTEQDKERAEQINSVIQDSINNNNPEKLHGIYLWDGYGDKQLILNRSPLNDETINAIRHNTGFVIKNMPLNTVFTIAVYYGITELIDTLEQHPKYYEEQLNNIPYEWNLYQKVDYIQANDPHKLSDNDCERLTAAYIKAVNQALQNILKNKDKNKLTNFSLRLTRMPNSYDPDEWCKGNYNARVEDKSFDYSVGWTVIANSQKSHIFAKETMAAIRDNMGFCLEYMNIETLEVFLDLNEELRVAAHKVKHVLRKFPPERLCKCSIAAYVSYLDILFGEELVERLCIAIKTNNPDIFGRNTLLPPVKPKFTQEQEGCIKNNLGFLYLHFRSDICDALSYDYKMVREQDIKDGIVKYLDGNPDLSNVKIDRIKAACELCSASEKIIAKLSEEIANSGSC